MKKLKVLYLLFLVSFLSYGQNIHYPETFWKLLDLNGSLELFGQYREIESLSANTENKEERYLFSGKLDLNTQSYFWHPNFLVLDFNGSYSPAAGEEFSILLPDYAIENTSKRLFVKTNFFRNKKINFSSYITYSEAFTNRENISGFDSNYFNWGGNFNYNNKKAPLTVSYLQYKDEQNERYTDRIYLNEGADLRARIKTSIGSRDKHEFNFSQRNFKNELLTVYTNENNTTDLNLRDQFFIDKNKNYGLYSFISNIYQTGTVDYDRFQLSERLVFKLPANFRFNGDYLYTDYTQQNIDSKLQRFFGELQHQWYNSLRTKIFYENFNNAVTSFDEDYTRVGFDITYTKKVPLKGKLVLNYNYFIQDHQRESEASEIQIFQEPYILVDGEIVLLQRPNIIIESVIVRDITGSLIYQENIDYILLQHEEFIEIQRLPGGQIVNSTQVFIDYTALDLGDYKYKLISKQFMGSLYLFNNLFEAYYKSLIRDYNDVEIENGLVLPYIDQQLYGLKLNYKFMKLGFEKDEYISNVVPYRLTRFYANLQGSFFKNKISSSLNGSYTNYDMIGEEGRKQKFTDISGNIMYNISPRTRLDIRMGYRMQEGEDIDLDLFTGRAELSTRYHQVLVKLTAEFYRREYLLTDNYNYNGINLKIIREF